MRLGKTQLEFETGYFVMDLFEVLEANRRVRAQGSLDDLNVAVMSHSTQPEDFRKFVASLQQQAGFADKADKPTFDKSGFERLKTKMKLGI
ncbi:hypothetical protein DCC85_14260 [Paenibacillus sp. CAA11]|uniref:hypothetical protein n=1 Tax=Paenibacillus sp. CAA11 TaxID=1532905 RepID=UPI000D3719A2|nr:hypothetical protein [Paenibacillus sp. CAA11]AWB45273.1 hypothetical protein DCC85_14260 [Paenibacillus sp. CAA11]